MLANILRVKPGANVPPGAILHYRFEELAIETVVKNYAGPTDGTRSGTVSSVAGVIGNAWNFPEAPSVNTNIVTPAGPVSFSAWVKFNTLATRQTIIGDISATGLDIGARLFIGVNGSNFDILVSDGSSSFYNGSSYPHGFSVGVFYHLVYTISGGSLKLYVNDVLLHSISLGISKGGASADALRLGKAGAFAGIYLNAALDQVRVYNYELSAAQVSQLYDEAA